MSTEYFDDEHFAVRYTRNGEVRQTKIPLTEDEALEKALRLADMGVMDAEVVDLLA